MKCGVLLFAALVFSFASWRSEICVRAFAFGNLCPFFPQFNVDPNKRVSAFRNLRPCICVHKFVSVHLCSKICVRAFHVKSYTFLQQFLSKYAKAFPFLRFISTRGQCFDMMRLQFLDRL